VIGLSLLLGVGTAFSVPAMQTLAPLLVPVEQVRHAVALTSVMMNASRVIGPALGAVVISGLGIPWAFTLNAGSYLVLIWALAYVRPRPQPPRPTQRVRMRDTLRELRADPRIMALLVLTFAISFAIDPTTTISPAFAEQVLREADTVSGYLIGTYRQTGIVALVFAGGIVVFGLSPGLWLALPALFVAGAAFLTTTTAATTRLLTTVPSEKHGRVMAVWSALFLGGRPIASLLDGALASASIRLAAVVMAQPLLAAATRVVLRPPAEE
jgi:MFS family permease